MEGRNKREQVGSHPTDSALISHYPVTVNSGKNRLIQPQLKINLALPDLCALFPNDNKFSSAVLYFQVWNLNQP